MIENDADAVRDVHTFESGPWKLVPLGNSIYVGRKDDALYRSRNFSSIAECQAYIAGFVDCEVTAARRATPPPETTP